DPRAVPDRTDRLDAFPQLRARLRRVLGQELIEVEAGADEAVPRPVAEDGPWELEERVAAVDPQPIDAGEPGIRGVDPHLVEDLHHARGQAVAAHLLASERRLLGDRDVDALLGQAV